MKTHILLTASLAALLLAGCATVPTGPSVMTLPGTGKSFEQFRFDDAECRSYALYQIGGATADTASVDAGVRSAAAATLIGAVAGAAIGGREGAGVGAGTGLIVGSMAGSGAAHRSAIGTQRQYDNAYIQCMYAKGHIVPIAGTTRGQFQGQSVERVPAPAGAYPPPPPPPGYVAPPPNPPR